MPDRDRPTTPKWALSAHHWRERAEEARTKTEGMKSDEARRQMLAIARCYEHMAEHTAKLAADIGRLYLLGTKKA